VPARYWRGGKVPLGEEYYHSPSTRAQSYWLHVVSIGRSRTPVGHEHGHTHEARFLIHYIADGQFWHRLHNQTYLARRGTVVLMDLREPAAYGNSGPGIATVLWVCFGGKDMPHLFAELNADKRPLFEEVDSVRFELLLKDLIELTRAKPDGYEPKAAGLLTLLLAELFAVRDAEGEFDIGLVQLPKRKAVLSNGVRDSIRYMARFFDSALDLKKLSGVAGLSMYHFVRVFRRETGMSPMHYLNAYRIEKAKQVLATSNHPLVQIGQMVGIASPFKFSRLFHKLVGTTPSQFRARAMRRKA
jgi:AraC-like DNA-binding protein